MPGASPCDGVMGVALMAASGATIYRTAYTMAISGPGRVETTKDGTYCGMGLDIDEIRTLFYTRGWNPAYSHQAWQRCLAQWEDFHNIKRIGRSIFFIPKFCDQTTCATKIERIMTPDAVAVI